MTPTDTEIEAVARAILGVTGVFKYDAARAAITAYNALPSQVERDANDRRYRHLQTAPFLSSPTPVAVRHTYIKGVYQNEHTLLMGDELDAAIDAAIAGEV